MKKQRINRGVNNVKKNVNKLIAIGIGLSIMSSNIASVSAAEHNKNSVSSSVQSTSNKVSDKKTLENNKDNKIIMNENLWNKDDDLSIKQSTSEKPILYLQEAIDAAIENSEKLALKENEILLYRDKMRYQDRIDDFYDSIDQNVYDFPYDKLELQEDQTRQSREFLEDQIASDIRSKYNAIVLKEIDIDKSKRDLKVKSKDLETMKTKVEIGMATPNQLTDAQIQIKTLKDNIKAKEDSLKNSKDYFKVLTDLDLDQYRLDRDIDYEVFRIDGSVDEYMDERIQEYLKYNDEILDLTKEYIEQLEDDEIDELPDAPSTKLPDPKDYVIIDKVEPVIDPTTGKPMIDPNTGKPVVKPIPLTNVSGGTVVDGAYAAKLIEYQKDQLEYFMKLKTYEAYIDGKYQSKEAEVKLNEAKKNLKNGLKECYATLLDLENKIEMLKNQAKSTETKLEFAKTQVDIGLMTKNEYKDKVIQSEELDTAIRKLSNIYNTLKDSIQKPWLLNAEK